MASGRKEKLRRRHARGFFFGSGIASAFLFDLDFGFCLTVQGIESMLIFFCTRCVPDLDPMYNQIKGKLYETKVVLIIS